MMRYSAIATTAALLMLNACSTLPPAEHIGEGTLSPSAPEKTSENIKDPAVDKKMFTAFELNGAMFARRVQQSWTAQVFWRQQSTKVYNIRLMGPLGQGAIVIEGRPQGVVYREGNTVLKSDNANTLLRKKTGVGLPVDDLYYWIRGIPAPGPIKEQQWDSAHHLTKLVQGAYTIEYQQYGQWNGHVLPMRLTLHGSNMMAKMVIKKWIVP
ncbi:MAG: lipoprotein insertase outer membrane protein LolB [Legionellaceae bacterium]|nr:lipoprotein insertase outer membrane protein LolB [Legionellaceae bacterium]